jgi:outer membrane protein TolC
VRAELEAAAVAVPEARLGLLAADRNARIQIARFEAGAGLGIEVIDAQNTRARTRRELAEAVLRYEAARLRLLAAVGRLSPEAVARLKHVSSQGSNSLHGNTQSGDPAAQRGMQH